MPYLRSASPLGMMSGLGIAIFLRDATHDRGRRGKYMCSACVGKRCNYKYAIALAIKALM